MPQISGPSAAFPLFPPSAISSIASVSSNDTAAERRWAGPVDALRVAMRAHRAQGSKLDQAIRTFFADVRRIPSAEILTTVFSQKPYPATVRVLSALCSSHVASCSEGLVALLARRSIADIADASRTLLDAVKPPLRAAMFSSNIDSYACGNDMPRVSSQGIVSLAVPMMGIRLPVFSDCVNAGAGSLTPQEAWQILLAPSAPDGLRTVLEALSNVQFSEIGRAAARALLDAALSSRADAVTMISARGLEMALARLCERLATVTPASEPVPERLHLTTARRDRRLVSMATGRPEAINLFANLPSESRLRDVVAAVRAVPEHIDASPLSVYADIRRAISRNIDALKSDGLQSQSHIIFMDDACDLITAESFDVDSATEWCLLLRGRSNDVNPNVRKVYDLVTRETVTALRRSGKHPYRSDALRAGDIVANRKALAFLTSASDEAVAAATAQGSAALNARKRLAE